MPPTIAPSASSTAIATEPSARIDTIGLPSGPSSVMPSGTIWIP
jgi:hypothetical protein